MFKSKLYWKVFANFALFLVIMTAMTVLTLNILSQIEQSYGLAASDTRLLTELHDLGVLLVDVPEATDRYLATHSSEAKDAVEDGWKDIDRVLGNVRDHLSDSSMISILRETRNQFFLWMTKVGEQKVLLADRGKTLSSPEFQTIARIEATEHYLTTARALYRELRAGVLAKQMNTINTADQLSRDIANFVTLINLMIAVFAVALGFVLTRSITTPLRLLKDGTQNIMAGRFEPIRLERTDEFGQLASDFNNMSLMLGNNYTRLNAYSELVTALNTHADIEAVQENSLRLLCQHSAASVGALYLFKKDSTILEFKTGFALKPTRSIRSYTLGEGIPGQCALQKETIELTDLPETASFHIDTGLVRVAPRHIIATPILFQEKVLGVIVLGSVGSFGELEKDIIQNSVAQIGVAITNARNNEAAQLLSREIATKNDELNSKNQELEKAYRVKSDFLASMSHELRTPLNSIIGFSSVLLGPNSDPLSKDQEMALQKVLKNGKHLLQLINDILDFSKIESGRMTVNVEVDTVASIVSSSIATVESLVKTKGLKLNETIDTNLPDLKTDVLKLKQILVNLLSNAVKFTERGEITVAATSDGDMISVSVRDTGIGIEEKNLGLVFQEFQQIESSHSRKYKGTGLGLPISRRFAQMLGGDLRVESVFGKGSTFILTIPPVYVAPDHEAEGEPGPARRTSAPPQSSAGRTGRVPTTTSRNT